MSRLYRQFNTEKYQKLSEKQIIEAIEKCVFTSIDTSVLTKSDYFTDLNRIFANGDVVLLRFAADNKKMFGRGIHWHGFNELIKDEIKPNNVIINLLSNKTLKTNQTFLELTDAYLEYDFELKRNIKKITIEDVSPFSFDGELTELTYNGGAYVKHLRTIGDTKKQCIDFVNEIMQNRFDDFKIYRILGAWTNWFSGIAWEYTYFIFDELKAEFWIFGISDTD